MPLYLSLASTGVIRVVGVLPAAGPQYSGQQLIVQVAGSPNRLFICTQNQAGVWQWINVATTG